MARRHDVKPGLLYRWKKELRPGVAKSDEPIFVPVTIAARPVPEAPTIPPPSRQPPLVEVSGNSETIDIRLANGRSVRVDQNIDAHALKRIINALDN